VTACRVLIVHYTPPGIIGGVEHIIEQHVRLLVERGIEVEIVAGRKGRAAVPVHVLPEIDAARASNVRVEQELAEGRVTPQFHTLVERIETVLEPLVRRFTSLIVHNAFTLHFSLPLTVALWRIAEQRRDRSVLAWCHDLSWTNPLYIPSMHPGYPWDLLRRPAPNTRYVTVSYERKEELETIWRGTDPPITVVPNGIDVVRVLRLSRATQEIVKRYALFDRDAVLLLPVRVTRRKNIEAGIRATRTLKDRGMDVRFLVSGPVAPHHPVRSLRYLESLKAMRRDLDVEDEIVLLTNDLGHRLSDRTVNELYTVADLLFFPSTQEGFGLPILEAGVLRAAAVVSDLAIFREVGGDNVLLFPPDAPGAVIADQIEAALRRPAARLFRRVVRQYRWDALADRLIVPLLAPAVIDV
jgi:mannosylglucosylglycerate synthase